MTDHGFRQARGFSNVNAIERVLENIVCMQLIADGYEITIGKVKEKEIDFIASKNGEIAYFQVSYLLNGEKTLEREFGVFQEIKDNYPKYVLSMDQLDFSRDGIIHKNIIDWLLEQNG